MDRRTFITGALGLATIPAPWMVARAQGGPVKLLLVREHGYDTKCLPCVAGKLYGVPSNINLDTAEQATGLLTFITDTVELSYEPDSGRPSSIPEATYSASVRTDATKRWMWSGQELNAGTVLQDRAWRLELANVPHRTAIQFHYGRDASWSRGCIILGHKTPSCPARGPCSFPDSPEPSVKSLRNYVESNAMASNTPIRVRVVGA